MWGRRGKDLGAAAAVFVAVAVSAPASGQHELAKLVAPDGAAWDNFGTAVAVSRDVIVVGSPRDDDLGSYSGSAYVFRRRATAWVLEAKLLAPDGEARDEFGTDVALKGNVAVIGAIRAEAAYVFRHDGSEWLEEARLAPWGDYAVYFGLAVACDGERVIVGAPLDDEACPFCGAAYIFRFDGRNWLPEARVHASDGTGGPEHFDLFGSSVSIRGDVALVGKPRSAFPYLWGPGAAYVFRFGGKGWVEEARLAIWDHTVVDQLGWSVALGDDTVVVGAPWGVGASGYTGTAHVYKGRPDMPADENPVWIEQATLVDPSGSEWDGFGTAVALDGDIVVVGAPYDDTNGDASGSALVFVQQGYSWTLRARLLPSDGDAGDLFGGAVAMAGDVVIVGARGDDEQGDGSGAAYVFGLGPDLGDGREVSQPRGEAAAHGVLAH
jgi:hypothetical protein